MAARRIATVLPEVRLICVLREAIDRLRSHHRHEIRRVCQQRTLVNAVAAAENPYVTLSSYHECLAPYLEAFLPEQLCIVRFEDLISQTAPGWTKVLRHLGLPLSSPPCTPHSVTASKPAYSRAMLWLWEPGCDRRLRLTVPRSVRRLAGAALLGDYGRCDDRGRFHDSSAILPRELTAPVWQDVHRLEARLGLDEPLRDSPTGVDPADGELTAAVHKVTSDKVGGCA